MIIMIIVKSPKFMSLFVNHVIELNELHELDQLFRILLHKFYVVSPSVSLSSMWSFLWLVDASDASCCHSKPPHSGTDLLPPPWNIVAHNAYMFHPLVVLNGTGTITYTALLTLLQWTEWKQEFYEGSEWSEHICDCFTNQSTSFILESSFRVRVRRYIFRQAYCVGLSV